MQIKEENRKEPPTKQIFTNQLICNSHFFLNEQYWSSQTQTRIQRVNMQPFFLSVTCQQPCPAGRSISLPDCAAGSRSSLGLQCRPWLRSALPRRGSSRPSAGGHPAASGAAGERERERTAVTVERWSLSVCPSVRLISGEASVRSSSRSPGVLLATLMTCTDEILQKY